MGCSWGQGRRPQPPSRPAQSRSFACAVGTLPQMCGTQSGQSRGRRQGTSAPACPLWTPQWAWCLHTRVCVRVWARQPWHNEGGHQQPSTQNRWYGCRWHVLELQAGKMLGCAGAGDPPQYGASTPLSMLWNCSNFHREAAGRQMLPHALATPPDAAWRWAPGSPRHMHHSSFHSRALPGLHRTRCESSGVLAGGCCASPAAAAAAARPPLAGRCCWECRRCIATASGKRGGRPESPAKLETRL